MSDAEYSQAIVESTMPHMTWVMTSQQSTSRLYMFIASLAGPAHNSGYGTNPNAAWLGLLCRMLNRLD